MYACIQSKYLVNKLQIKTQKTSSEKISMLVTSLPCVNELISISRATFDRVS